MSRSVERVDEKGVSASGVFFSLCKSLPQAADLAPFDFVFQLHAPFYFWRNGPTEMERQPLGAPFTGASGAASAWQFLQVRLEGRPFYNLFLHPACLEPQRAEARHPDKLPYRQTPLLRLLISGICSLLASGEALPGALLELKMQELLLLLYQGFGMRMIPPLGPDEREKMVLQKLVDASIKEDLKIRQLAKRNHQSVSSFKRHFRHHFNTTPGRYIRKQKLERALQDLRNGKASKECYLAYGYESVSNFSHAFKRAFGVTPAYFQRRITNRPAV